MTAMQIKNEPWLKTNKREKQRHEAHKQIHYSFYYLVWVGHKVFFLYVVSKTNNHKKKKGGWTYNRRKLGGIAHSCSFFTLSVIVVTRARWQREDRIRVYPCVRACVCVCVCVRAGRGGAIMLLLFGPHMNSCMVINGTWSPVRLQTNYCLIFASPTHPPPPPHPLGTHTHTHTHTHRLGRNTCRCRDADGKHILTTPSKNQFGPLSVSGSWG